MNTDSRPAPAKNRRKAAFTRLLIGLGVVVVALAIVYWLGLSRGHAQMARQKADCDGHLQTLRAQTADAQAQAAAAQAQNRLMTARGQLYQAAIALDRRNFGIADDDVAKAGQTLDSAPPADAAPLAAVRQAIAGTKVTVSQDLDKQRAHLLDMASQLDALIH